MIPSSRSSSSLAQQTGASELAQKRAEGIRDYLVKFGAKTTQLLVGSEVTPGGAKNQESAVVSIMQ